MRAGDHQAMQDMYAVKVDGGQFHIVGKVAAGAAIGPDACSRQVGGMLDWLQFVLAPQVVNGLSIGVAVVLMALGLTIIFGLLDVINMAHGEFYAIGAYAALGLIGAGLPFWWALALTPLLMALVGYATERALIQRVFHSKDRHTLTLLLTFGIAIILEDILKIVFGANPLRIEQPITGATEMFGLFFPPTTACS